MKKLLIAATVFFALACNNTSSDTAATKAGGAKTLEDSLYQQTMDIHNEIMPKMGKLMGWEKLAKKQSDSIKASLSSTTYPVELARKIASDANKLDSINERLKGAEKAMNDWMDQFDPDPKMPTTEERVAYFADQKKKAEAMRLQFLDAFHSAEAFFEAGASSK